MTYFLEGTETLELLGLFDVNNSNDFSDSKTFTTPSLSLKPLRHLQNGTPATLHERVKELIEEEQLFIDPDLVVQIALGLIHGNVILYGPPGTGKTSLARLISKLFHTKIPQIWTANPEWTTFDVIGGLAPTLLNGKEVITGKLGKVTSDMHECIREIKNYDEDDVESFQASWCVIDEMNRCDLDKAFGDLFTALSSGDIENRRINLPFMEEENEKYIYVPGRFRLIGTINSYDKDFIQDFSVALSRRFRFYPVDIPPRDQLENEFKLLWNKAKNTVIQRLGDWGATETVIETIRLSLANINGINYWNGLKVLIDYIRWDEEIGIPVGSSQIIEIFTGILTQVIALEKIDLVTSPVDETEQISAQKFILTALDHSIAESLVKQLDSVQGIENLIAHLRKAPLNFITMGPTLIELSRLAKDNELV